MCRPTLLSYERLSVYVMAKSSNFFLFVVANSCRQQNRPLSLAGVFATPYRQFFEFLASLCRVFGEFGLKQLNGLLFKIEIKLILKICKVL